jgi:hypothetical protein
MAGDRSVTIGRDAVGNVITTGDHNTVKARISATKREVAPGEPAPPPVDVAKELASIREALTSLSSQNASKIGRALDDAADEAAKPDGGDKDEVGKALDRALGYAKSATAFATTVAGLGPPLHNLVGWLGDQWSTLLTHLG